MELYETEIYEFIYEIKNKFDIDILVNYKDKTYKNEEWE
jgi:hypothetical protein